jgi:serine/threonine-protein kinase
MATRLPSGSEAVRLPSTFGKYVLLRRIAKGGMAELYLGLHHSLAGFEKLVVIKRILPLLNCEQEFIDMLQHEARIAATLSHPNIAQVYDVGAVDGTYFIAMEYVPGEDLRAIQRQLAANEGRFPLEQAVSVALGLCSGLGYAHDKCDLGGHPLGIVHRDISPHNVIVTFSGDVKLIDFGVAKSRLRLGDQTRSGSIKGKIAYMSPEQALGQPLDHRSDVFAIGTTLYELTTGRRPFRGKTDFDTLRLVGAAGFEPPSRVQPGYPRELEAIVLRAMAKLPEDRYPTARDMQRDLERFVHAARLRASQIALSDFMHSVMGDRLRAQEELLAKAKLMADLVDRPAETADRPSFHRSVPPGAMSVTHFGIAEPRRTGWRGLLGVPAAVAAAAAISLLAMSPRSAWEEVGDRSGAWFHVEETADSARTSELEFRSIPMGHLTVKASGRGCRISVDGKVVGVAPVYTPSGVPQGLDLALPAGPHAVECAPGSSKVLSLNVRVDPGETMQVGFVVP